jgi:hypothetical protein
VDSEGGAYVDCNNGYRAFGGRSGAPSLGWESACLRIGTNRRFLQLTFGLIGVSIRSWRGAIGSVCTTDRP